MIHDSTDLDREFEGLLPGAIVLEPSHLQQARQIGRRLSSPVRQWQTYLNALAFFSFEDWIAERAGELNFNQENCTLFQPDYAKIIPAVCNLQVGDFKVCLMAMGNWNNPAVAVPRAAIDLSKFTAHFYVVLEISEELGEARIKAFLDYNQIREQLTFQPLQLEADWTYQLPLAAWDSNPDDLLLYFRCRESAAIPLPPLPTHSPSVLSALQNQLTQLLPQLQACEGQLWEILTWEQGAILLSDRELWNWFITKIEPQETVSLHRLKRLAQPFLNVAVWLRDEIDEVARELSWVLLPTFASESNFSFNSVALAMRSPLEELEAIITFLKRDGSNIPPNARAAYHNFQLASVPLRLYAVTGSLLSPESIPEWKLLLVLGGIPSSTRLPDGTHLAISYNQELLVEQVQKPDNLAPYLYAIIAGTWDEEFSVTITLADGTTTTFPPFAFHPH
ncbi:MAG: DUF1822 family protein [Actinomycetota bacterium]